MARKQAPPKMPAFRFGGAAPGPGATAPDPQPIPMPPGVAGVDYEAHQASIVAPPSTVALPVYTGLKRWTACDVYIDTSAVTVTTGLNGYGCLVVQVFAVTAGVRVLVASGRFGPDDALVGPRKKLIAYRGGAERYEVQAWSVDGGIGGNPPPFLVSVILSNLDADYDDENEVGLIPWPTPSGSGGLTNATTILGGSDDLASSLEILKVYAASSVATRFLTFSTAAGVLLSVPISAPAGGIIYTGRTLLKVAPHKCTIAISSTARTVTAVVGGDSGYTVYYR